MITDPDSLLQALRLPLQPMPVDALRQFPVRVPTAYLKRIRPGDTGDPLLRQILPLTAEDQPATGYTRDPLNEAAATPVPAILHKYHGRALLLATSTCAIHCRYCFRRHFAYPQARGTQWRQALEYLRVTPSVNEVILSGGDPLTLSNRRLDILFTALENISHLCRLRIHSRAPVATPERLDPQLVARLTRSRLRIVLVTHVNHARELSTQAECALRQFSLTPVTLLNQGVLLSGVNDSAEAQQELADRLFECGVLPYYLHLPDKVAGTAHFHVGLHTAQEILYKVREHLPGYLVPRLVKERPGAPYKIPLL